MQVDPSRQLADMLAERAALPQTHADGVYFNMPMEEYLEDQALGSSDMFKLAYSPCDYWYGSSMNPKRPARKSTPAQDLGTALHMLVLEGEAAFDRAYVRGADNDDASLTPSEKAQRTKKANELAAKLRKTALPAEAYDRIAIAGAMISKNPKLSTAFSGGAAEVSVFWTETHARSPGDPTPRLMRKKARLDYLKPRGIGDLKRVANQFEIPFERACKNAITNYNYHVQARHYLWARERMTALIQADKVRWLGGAEAPSARERDMPIGSLLDDIIKTKRFAWQWVFWQGERAPLTLSFVLSPGNPVLEAAQSVLERAQANWIDYLDRFGTGQWLDLADPKELFMEDMPPWFARD